jgi:hypothetical protein
VVRPQRPGDAPLRGEGKPLQQAGEADPLFRQEEVVFEKVFESQSRKVSEWGAEGGLFLEEGQREEVHSEEVRREEVVESLYRHKGRRQEVLELRAKVLARTQGPGNGQRVTDHAERSEAKHEARETLDSHS